MGLKGGISILFLIGFIVVIVGDVLHLIGLATPEWSVYEMQAQGLFQGCNLGACSSHDYTGQSTELGHRVRASAAMNVIGALFGLAAFKLAMFHLGMGCLGKEPTRSLPLVGGVFAIIAFCFVLIGVAVWGGAVHDDHLDDGPNDWEIGYSFALSITGGILLLIGGIILLISNIKSVGSAQVSE